MSQRETLAQRLGYSADDRLLIVNCDDLGSSHSANVATLQCIEQGIATSATLMVPCPWALDAVNLSKATDIGVHLTLTAEYPGYRWRALTALPSLHDESGYLPRTMEESHRQARIEDVRAECIAQVERALAWGVDVTHIDAHMGTMQADPRFFDIYVDIAATFDVPLRMISAQQESRLNFRCRDVATRRGLLFPDHFISPWGRPTREVLLEAIAAMPAGVSEIYAHPVLEGADLRAYDPTHPDVRAADHDCLMDPGIRRQIDAAGIRLISFRELRDLQRSMR